MGRQAGLFVAIHLGIRHNAPSYMRDVEAASSRLQGATRDGTRVALLYLQGRVVASVERRTSMNGAIAERITEADFRSTPSGSVASGKVSFKPPPVDGWKITAKGKALAFRWPAMGAGPGRGGKWLFKSVQHPGSRPYKLIPETAIASERGIEAAYSGALRRVS